MKNKKQISKDLEAKIKIGIKPIGAYILAKPEMFKEVPRSSGIIIESQEMQPKQTICTVIDMGNGITLPNGTKTQFSVKQGDRIMIKSYAGDKITGDDNEEYLFILNSDILAIL